jgi:hypothetical protein
MQDVITKCDVCKTPKGETNHWWRAKIVRKAIIVLPLSQAAGASGADLCGREHLHQWIDAQLNVIGGN